MSHGVTLRHVKVGKPKDRQVNFKLDEELHDTLVEAARADDVPMSTVVRMALRDYLHGRHR